MNLRYYCIAFTTLLRKEIWRFIRMWSQTVLPAVITTSLYFIIFGHFIGSQLGAIHGYSYMQYITPGLIMMNVITNSYANVSTSFYISRFQKSIEEILVSPISEFTLILAYTAGGIMRGLVIGLVVALVALGFSHSPLQHPLTALAIVLLAAALFSLAGFANALFAKKFDDIAIVPTFVLTPLTYLGGVFYSLTMLPVFWQKISMANPVLYIVDALRYSVLGIAEIPIAYTLTMLSMLVLLAFLANWYLLRKGVGIRT